MEQRGFLYGCKNYRATRQLLKRAPVKERPPLPLEQEQSESPDGLEAREGSGETVPETPQHQSENRDCGGGGTSSEGGNSTFGIRQRVNCWRHYLSVDNFIDKSK